MDRWADYRDAEAFREIVQQYGAMVFGACSRILRNATDAEEVTQECFEILATAKTPPAGYTLGTWLHGMATNRALMRLRSERRRITRETAYALRQPQTVNVGWNDIYHYVDEAVAALPEDLRIPLIYHFYEGLSDRKIAQMLGLPRRTTRDRIARGVACVADALRVKGVTLGTAVLATLMRAKLAEALPLTASLSASLGQLALAHPGCRPAPGTSVLSKAAAFWSGTAGKSLAALIALSAMLWLATHAARPVRPRAEALMQSGNGMSISAAHGRRVDDGDGAQTEIGFSATPPDFTAMLPPTLEENGKFGVAAVVLQDLNGDAIADMGVGAPNQRGDAPEGVPGRVHILDGANGACIATLDSPHPEPACVPWACDAKGEFGMTLTTLQDVNGNGYRELVVGAPGERVGEYYAAGRVYIFDSFTRELIRTLQTPNLERHANFGTSLDTVPDIDQDGIEDLVVGAGQESPPKRDADGHAYHLTAAGRAYIISGATGQILQTLVSPDGWDAHMFGRDVAGVADLNEDGAGDVVIGQNADGVDHAHVFSGATGAHLASLRSPIEPDEGGFGTPLLAIPDCNGNGFADFLVASPKETVAGRSQSGRVYAFDGDTFTLLRTFEPTAAGQRQFGCTMAYAGDITGDGQPDYLFGVHDDSGPKDSSAAIAVFSAADGAYEGTLRLPDTGNADSYGALQIASVADMNGDGLSELLATAPFATSGDMTGAGRVFLIKSPFFPQVDMPAGAAERRMGIARAGHIYAEYIHDDVKHTEASRGLSIFASAPHAERRFVRFARWLWRTITGNELRTAGVGDSAEAVVTGADAATPRPLDSRFGCRPQAPANRAQP